MTTDKKDYQAGYVAGRRKTEADIAKIESAITLKKERIYLACLDMVLKNCSNWLLDKAPVNDAKSYCRLAKIFANIAISEIDK